MTVPGTIQKEKKSYQKPELKSIAMVADEVLATGCKAAAFPGVGKSPASCILAPCSLMGS